MTEDAGDTGGQRPKVSVIVPNYNHARFLPRRIDSIMAQTFRDFELILLDDASSDESLEVFSGYEGRPGIRIVANRHNSGSPFAQWRRGVRMARGEFVWIAESDDSCSEQFLESLVALLDAHPRAGLAYCQSDFVDENDQVLRTGIDWTIRFDRDHWEQSYVHDGRRELGERLVLGNTIPNASAVIARREAIEDALASLGPMKLAGDWWIWSRIAMHWDIAFLNRPLNQWRCHGATVRSSVNDFLACAEMSRVLRFICENVDIPDDSRRFGAKLLMTNWAQSVARSGLKPPINLHLELHANLAACVPWAGPKMLRTLAGVLAVMRFGRNARL